MKKSKFLIPLIALLCGCTSSNLPDVKENNVIQYDEIYECSAFSFAENKNILSGDRKEDIKNYFLSNASHMMKDSEYSFIYKGKMKEHDFKLNVPYDSSKTEKPYLVASTFNVTDEESRPYRSYFFSYYTEDFSDFRSTEFIVTYSTIYVRDKKEYEADTDITYKNIRYGSAPKIEEVSFSVASQDDVLKGEQRDEKEMGASGFECVRALSSYVDTLLKTINPDYSLW